METIGTPAALLKRCDAYVKRTRTHGPHEIKRSTLSLKLFNDGKVLDRLADGGDIRTQPLAAGWAALVKLEAALERAEPRAPAKAAKRRA